MEIELTVVIPTHLRPRLLEEAIQSVLDQTRPPNEIVVVDDMSHPNTRDVVETYARRRPRQIIRYATNDPQTRNASTSRNMGARLSQSTHLAFLDDDDCWNERHIEYALAEITESNADFVISPLLICQSGRTRIGPTVPPRIKAKDVIARNPGMTGSNLLISRSAFDAVGGFDETLPVSNDKDLLYRLLKSGATYSVSHIPTVFYRRHEMEALTQWNAKRAAGMQTYRDRHRNELGLRDWLYLTSQIQSAKAGSSKAISRLGYKTTSCLLYPPRVLHRLPNFLSFRDQPESGDTW